MIERVKSGEPNLDDVDTLEGFLRLPFDFRIYMSDIGWFLTFNHDNKGNRIRWN